MIRVLLLLDYASEYDRKLLRGIMRYSKEKGPWLFYRMSNLSGREPGFYNKVIEWAETWKADAIIGRWNEDDIGMLERLSIPVVLQNYLRRRTDFSTITGDYEGTGQIAAQFFYRKRYASYAFFGLKGVVWSEERLAGFRDEVAKYGCAFSSLLIERDSEIDRVAIACWLKSLPQRTALFCCDDERALMITEIGKIEHIDIPEDVAVLGVDNDDLICGISDPPISSIGLEVEQGGYNLCRHLHDQILNSSGRRFSVVINPVEVHERASTSTYNISDPAILKIVRYIDTHFTDDLSVRTIMENVPMSRRTMETKFRKEVGKSVYQYILDCRIEFVAQQLISTEKSLADIAAEAGIRDYSSLARIFKKRKKLTPQEFRIQHCVFSR